MISGRKSRDPRWYAEWREDAFNELGKKQETLQTDFNLGSWPRYDYDLEAGRLTFSDDAGPKVGCHVQVVGTIGKKDWLWSWANASLPEHSTRDLSQVRAYGEAHGNAELTSASIKANSLEGLGWMLTAVTARLLAAEGAYRPPNGLFMVCRSVRFLS